MPQKPVTKVNYFKADLFSLGAHAILLVLLCAGSIFKNSRMGLMISQDQNKYLSTVREDVVRPPCSTRSSEDK